jgi:hypothetical protein
MKMKALKIKLIAELSRDPIPITSSHKSCMRTKKNTILSLIKREENTHQTENEMPSSIQKYT